MNKDSIHAIVYTDFHDQIGPNPIYWYPTELSENVRMLVGIKTVTLLSASHGFVPESLIIIPFPSIKLKAIIKYIEREDSTRRGGAAQYAITFLFKDSDDIIFYKRAGNAVECVLRTLSTSSANLLLMAWLPRGPARLSPGTGSFHPPGCGRSLLYL